MIVPLLIAAAAIFGIAGCGAYKKTPRNSQEAKEEVPPADRPTQAYTDVCGDLEEYGELYVDTCSYYADQCYTQNTLKEKGAHEIRVEAWDRTLYSGNSYDDCIEKSRYFTKWHGPLPYEKLPKRFRWPLGTHLVLQDESIIVDDPKNHSEKWKPIAERILVERGLLKQGEGIEKLINGRIVGARASKSGKKELFIVMLDYHKKENVQSQIVNNVDKLHKRGIKLIGVENIPAFHNVACDQKRNDAAAIMLACKIGPSDTVIGVEDWDTHITHLLAYNRFINATDFSSDEKKCDLLELRATLNSLAILRSLFIFNNLLGVMTSESKLKTDKAVLIIGGAHLRDLQAMFDAKDLNYIAVAVPAYDPLTLKNIDEKRGRYDLVTVGGSIANINSMCD